jgi:hypothetical protein
MTDEQFDAEMARQYERLSKLYGPDVAAEYIKEIKAERAGMAKKYTENQNESILRTGLAIMGGKSRHAAVNIGEGGIAGLDAFQRGKKDLDAQAAALRREEMQAAMQSQQRGDMIRGQSIGRTDRRDTEMRADRNEYIGNMRDWNSFRMDAAKLGIEDRKVDAMFANVNAEYAKIRAIQGANKDDKVLAVMDRAFEGASKSVMDRFKDNPQALRRFADDPRAFMALVLPEYESRVQATLEMFGQARGDIRGGASGSPQGQSFDASRFFSRAPAR